MEKPCINKVILSYLTVFPVKLWTPAKISWMFIVSIRCEMKPQKITAKPQHGFVTTWYKTTSWAFLPQLIFKNQTAKFGIALEATVNNYCQNQILQHYEFSGEGFSATKKYRSKTTNHSQLACPFELHVKQTPVSLASNWLVSFCSHTRCPALSDHIYSIPRRFPHDISLIYHSYLFSFCH